MISFFRLQHINSKTDSEKMRYSVFEFICLLYYCIIRLFFFQLNNSNCGINMLAKQAVLKAKNGSRFLQVG